MRGHRVAGLGAPPGGHVRNRRLDFGPCRLTGPLTLALCHQILILKERPRRIRSLQSSRSEPKRAAQLVRRYGTLNGVLEFGLFQLRLRCFASIVDCDDGCVSALSIAGRSDTRLGLISEPRARLQIETIGRPLVGRRPDLWPGMSRRVDLHRAAIGEPTGRAAVQSIFAAKVPLDAIGGKRYGDET